MLRSPQKKSYQNELKFLSHEKGIEPSATLLSQEV